MKRIDLFLFSTIGVAAMLAIVIVVNVIGGFLKARIDLTEDNLFTLSDGTKEIVGELDTPIELRFYATRDEKVMPPQLKTYIKRVEDLLDEYRQHSNGMLTIKKFNPEPDSDAEDLARLDGVDARAISLDEQIYMGLSVTMLDETVAIPFLDPSRETLLEYDLTRAISQIATVDKPVVGIMSGLPVFGQPANPMMQQMGQRPQEPWILVGQLKQDFDVREIAMTADEIDSDVSVLVVIHPKNITETAEYAIDQFLMRGGKLFACLDSQAIIDQQPQQQNNMLGSPPSASNLEKLLTAWGLSFETGKTVADLSFAKEVSFRQGSPPQLQPTILFVNDKGINQEEVVTSQIDSLLLPFPGSFSGTPVDGLEQTVLLHSTSEAQLVDGFMAQLSGPQIAKEFQSDDKEYTLALRLNGKFKTAFADGKPAADDASAEDDLDQEDDPNEAEHLTEATEDTVVVLVGDADWLFDNFSARAQNFLGTRLLQFLNGNIPLAQNIVEQLGGDSRLIGVRSRATMNRPFTKIRDMQIEAENAYRAKIKELEDKVQQTQTKLNELQQNRTDVQNPNQRFVLSPQQQAEIENLRKAQADNNKQLKQMRRDLRKDIDALETQLKWINIAGMPFVVTVGGILLAMIKRKKTAAR